LTASGLPTENSISSAFSRTNPGNAANKLESSKFSTVQLILYESPYRIEKLLGELNEVFPRNAKSCSARELTKKFEEFLRGKPTELLELTKKRSLKGEFVVMIAPESGAKQTFPGFRIASGPAPA